MTEQPDAILRRFPGPVTLFASRKKWLLVFLGSAVFAAGGVWMVEKGASGGWFVLIVFAVFAIIAGLMLVPSAGSLKLDRDGFEATSLFRSHRVRWQDATSFTPVAIPPSMQKMVCYDNASLAGGALAKVNVAIAGHNAALPDSYGLAVDELARLMAQWRARAVGETA
jgi:hypothetical protein